jgi:hypothetical protein
MSSPNTPAPASPVVQRQKEMANLYPSTSDKEGFKVRLSDSSGGSSCKVSNSKKWKISLLAGILFLIISAPLLYKLVDGLLKKIRPELSVCDEHGCPTPLGLAIHAVVFVILTRLLMK